LEIFEVDNQPTNPTPTPAPEPTPAEPVVEAPANVETNEAAVEAPVEAPVEEPAAPAEPATEPAVESEVPAEEPAAPAEASAPVEAPVETPAEPVAAPVEPVAAPAEPVAPIESAPVMPEMPGVINPQPVAQAQGTAAPAKKSNTTLILGIVLGIVVLAGIGVGAFMLLGNNDKKPSTPVTTNTPAPTSDIKTVSCTASGAAWSIAQEVVVDEAEKKVTEIGFTLKADYTKIQNTGETTTISTETEPDPEQAGIMVVALMAMAFQNAEKVNGVTITDNSTETAADLTYRAIREEVEDEETLKQFENNDGKTAEELKTEAETSGADSGVTYACTIK
jgi:hypothetical protein